MSSEPGFAISEALAWISAGHGAALATVVNTWGSSPLPPGSMLAIRDDGTFSGSVSGGCIETAVVERAQGVIENGQPVLLDFSVTDKQAWDVGLACGGAIRVFVERVERPGVLADILEHRPAALVTHLESGAEAVVRPGTSPAGELALVDATVEAVIAALEADRAVPLDDPAGPVFVRVFNRPLRMIIIGAVHVAQELAPMAERAGFDVSVLDPREAYASPERFPGIRLATGLPDEELERMVPDARTAIVALTHNVMFDDPALLVALESNAFYIGALGSTRTHAKRLDRLRVAVEDEESMARIHAPIGLDLGGRTPAEIAVAILAEAIAARYGKDPRA